MSKLDVDRVKSAKNALKQRLRADPRLVGIGIVLEEPTPFLKVNWASQPPAEAMIAYIDGVRVEHTIIGPLRSKQSRALSELAASDADLLWGERPDYMVIHEAP